MVPMNGVPGEVCQTIVQGVRDWDYKPKNWSKFARELLVVVCGIRPVVLCDEVNFQNGDWKVIGEFLSWVCGLSGVPMKGMVYKDEGWEVEGDMGVLYLVNPQLVKDNCSMVASNRWPVYALEIPAKGFVRLEGGQRITQYLVNVVDSMLDTLESSDSIILDLNTVKSFNELAPTLTGWLLEYPVIYAHENGCLSFNPGGVVVPMDSKVVVRCCAENKIVTISQPRMAKTRVPQLFSFTFPTDLLTCSEIEEALSAINGKMSARTGKSTDIWGPLCVVTEEAGKVAWAV